MPSNPLEVVERERRYLEQLQASIRATAPVLHSAARTIADTARLLSKLENQGFLTRRPPPKTE